jgi:hypothetical protein
MWYTIFHRCHEAHESTCRLVDLFLNHQDFEASILPNSKTEGA